jgi:hypothetical protein
LVSLFRYKDRHTHVPNAQTPVVAVQTVVSLRDTPVALSIVLFFQVLGAAVLISASQAVFLGALLPQMHIINASITRQQVIEAGATGLKDLVAPDQRPAVLVAYARGLRLVFLVAVGFAGLATIMALPVEWKTLKKNETRDGEKAASTSSLRSESKTE